MRIRLTFALLATFCGNIFGAAVTIVPTTKHQTIEGIGAAMAMCEGWLPGEPYHDELYDTLFKATGISILRIGNWLQDTAGDISADSMIVAEYRKRNPFGKVLVSSWTPPNYLKANNNSSGSASPNSLKKVNGKFVYDQFGKWWQASVRRYNKSGIKPDYITIQNEVNWNTDYASALFNPTENDSIAAYPQALKAVHDSLASLPKPPRILGPEVLGTAYNGMENYAKTMTDTSAFYGWAFHLYGSGNYDYPPSFLSNNTASFSGLYKTISNKPRFMTEYCNLNNPERNAMSLANPDTTKDWLNLAWLMQEAFTKIDLTGWVFWDMVWQNNSNMVAIFASWDKSAWPSNSPHGFFVRRTLPALGQYSRFVRGGWVRIDATPMDTALKVSAFVSPNNDSISVVVVNPSFAPVTFNPMIVQSAVPGGFVWTTSSTQSLQKTGTWLAGQDLTVAARSVITLNGSLGAAAAGASFYRNFNYDGFAARLPEGSYTRADLTSLGVQDNDISSMKIDSGMSVDLFDDDNFQTLLGTYTVDQTNFVTLGINDKVSSLRISKMSTAVRDPNKAGARVRWSDGALLLPETESGRLQIVNARGQSRIVEVAGGRAQTGILPSGLYRTRFPGANSNESSSFIVLP